MKKCFYLAIRNLKETVRDPLSAIFCVGFPLVMLIIMQLIFMNIDFTPPNFAIENYASGICVFGYTFTSLCVALQITADKNTSFIKRINIAPINAFSYIFSFFLSAIPVVLAQTLLFFLVALIFGFGFGANFFLSIIYLLPSAAFYICLGILVGSLCKKETQTGPVSSIIISCVGILGGVFMPLESIGGGFATFVNILPFSHTVAIASELWSEGAACIYPHILYILGYTFALIIGIFLIHRFKKS